MFIDMVAREDLTTSGIYFAALVL